MRTRHPLRCICSRAPLLAYYGLDDEGRAYLHQKVYKQHRIFGESVFRGGVVSLKCRECYRWTNVRLGKRREVIGTPTISAPDVISTPGGQSLHPPSSRK